MEFPRQEYWSGLPFPSPGDHSNVDKMFPALVGGFFTLNHLRAYGPVVKNLFANAEDARDAGLIPGSGRSPGGGNDNLLQYFCLENPMDR